MAMETSIWSVPFMTVLLWVVLAVFAFATGFIGYLAGSRQPIGSTGVLFIFGDTLFAIVTLLAWRGIAEGFEGVELLVIGLTAERPLQIPEEASVAFMAIFPVVWVTAVSVFALILARRMRAKKNTSARRTT